MITKKEDLINTYIENDFGELRDLYIAKCKEFNITVDEEVEWYDWKHVMVDGGSGVYFLNTENYEPVAKKITLSDLKTKRTRTEYEKVTESASHVIDEFENGGKFYYTAPSLTKPALANRDGVFNKLRDGDTLYRKVEKEIDERQEFIERACNVVRTSAQEDIQVIGKMYDAGCRFVGANGEIE